MGYSLTTFKNGTTIMCKVKGTMTPITAFVPEPGTGQICSTLGNNYHRFIRDRDGYSLSGQEGEDVTIRLEGNFDGFFDGEYVIVKLVDHIHRFRLVETNSDALLDEFTLTLPRSGAYLIWVIESFGFGHFGKFVGDYCLTLKSSEDAWQTLEPTWLVE